ncbi:MAG TPA: hypothetical protein VK158_03335 [Acidobacteriota bacterium]|nr:hypothetical protein [Acidobacteriota bacterium]
MDRGDFGEVLGTVPRIVTPARPKVYSVTDIVLNRNLPDYATVAGRLFQCSVGEGLLEKRVSLVLYENTTKLWLHFEIHPLSGDMDRLYVWTNAYTGKVMAANINTHSRRAQALYFGSKAFDLV